VSLDGCLDLMGKLPPTLAPRTRKHIGQVLARLFAMAVFPASRH
jgi:hypothetical protein